jgi:diacylglycerol kinase (ATP)
LKIFFFIINGAAGNGRSKKTWSRLKRLLDKKNILYRYYFTQYPNHSEVITKKIVHSERGKIAAIITVGGDGTIHEVVNGLMNHSNVNIGFIPAGSGNDFARGFQIPKSSSKALEFILNFDGSIPKVDVGSFQLNNMPEKRLFINSLGVGFDAEVSMEANKLRMKKWLNLLGIGSFTYVVALLKKAITFQQTDVELTIDDQILYYPKVWFITVSNQPYYGGGMQISPSALPNDGLLNITVVHDLSRIKLLLIFVSVFLGKHTMFKEVRTRTGKKVTITSNESLHIHTDGESAGVSPVSIEVLPLYFQVYSNL